ncbi:hypothetical protein [Caballeronia sp. LZ032]|uniref:hypothetical protein n=1 Tax=Caballeronia sp. LZ032 TaxID=3038565 RepID=UPI002859B517|nr:hypothetical protein [Caballeronia sp. LZ032]MDR5884097.1 hypothetical protein [Caballeronia sp. LZ032]
MEHYVGKQLAHNPLALAGLYRDGLGRQWKNQTEAARALAKLGVRREHVNRAARIGSMPPEILTLFRDAGMFDKTARELLSLQRTDGLEVLVQRAQSISPEGKSCADIVQLLSGQPRRVRQRQRSSVGASSSPLLRAARYAEGVASKEWSTQAAASELAGWNEGRLSTATSVARLPGVITELFDAKRFTTQHALDLLAIVKLLGVSKVVKNANLLHERPSRRSSKEILNLLVAGDSAPDCEVSSSRKGTKLTISFSFDVSPARSCLVDVKQLKMLAASALKNSVELSS